MAGGTEAMDRSGIGSAVTSATAARQLRNGWRRKPTVATRWVGKTVAYIERRQLEQRDKSGRTRSVVRYKVRYRDAAGKPHSETKRRLVDAERRKAEIELDVGNGLWRDPRRGEIRLEKWAAEWIQTRHDLRLTTRTRLEITLKVQVLPRFGTTPLVRITNAAVRSWVAEMLSRRPLPLHHPQSCLRASPMSRRGDRGQPTGDQPSDQRAAAFGATQAAAIPLPVGGGAAGRRHARQVQSHGARWCLRWSALG